MSRGSSWPRIVGDGPRPKHAQLRDALAELADHRAGPGHRDPVRARADDDVRRVPGDGAQGHRRLVVDGLLQRIHGRGTFVARPAAGEPAAPRVVQPGHAPPRPHPVHPAAQRRAGPASGRGRRGARARRRRPGLEAGPGPARRRPADRAGERLVPQGRCCPASTGTTSAARCTSCSPASSTSPSTAPSRRCGARPPTATIADPPRRSAAHTPLLVFRRVSKAGGRPLEYVVSRYRGDRYQIHMSLGRDDIGPSSTTEGNSSEHSRRVLGRDHHREQEVQPRARSRSSAGA